MSCCNPRGCNGFFTPRLARRAAKRYREKGIDKTAQRMIGFLEQHGIAGATVLEVGGGVGELEIECLKRGAARTLNLELSPAYDEEATRLLREARLEGRAERRLHDLAADPDGIEPADVVVLHRVVCCYRDYENPAVGMLKSVSRTGGSPVKTGKPAVKTWVRSAKRPFAGRTARALAGNAAATAAPTPPRRTVRRRNRGAPLSSRSRVNCSRTV